MVYIALCIHIDTVVSVVMYLNAIEKYTFLIALPSIQVNGITKNLYLNLSSVKDCMTHIWRLWLHDPHQFAVVAVCIYEVDFKGILLPL